jgi:hypothetical protein
VEQAPTPSSSEPEPGPQLWERTEWARMSERAAAGARSDAVASVVLGVATLAIRFLLPIMARSPGISQLVVPLSLLVMVGGVGGLLLGRRAAYRTHENVDRRGGMLATLGTWIGWGNVVLTVAGFFLAPVDNFLHMPR